MQSVERSASRRVRFNWPGLRLDSFRRRPQDRSSATSSGETGDGITRTDRSILNRFTHHAPLEGPIPELFPVGLFFFLVPFIAKAVFTRASWSGQFSVECTRYRWIFNPNSTSSMAVGGEKSIMEMFDNSNNIRNEIEENFCEKQKANRRKKKSCIMEIFDNSRSTFVTFRMKWKKTVKRTTRKIELFFVFPVLLWNVTYYNT